MDTNVLSYKSNHPNVYICTYTHICIFHICCILVHETHPISLSCWSKCLFLDCHYSLLLRHSFLSSTDDEDDAEDFGAVAAAAVDDCGGCDEDDGDDDDDVALSLCSDVDGHVGVACG